MSVEFHPLVSIVIPVYNGSNYLREAIDSALAQTYDNIEVIVVNDGSNDNGATEAIALSYGDKIRYFRKENGGVATALNLGIENMRGEYFSWLSHDDVYLPEKIEKQIDFIGYFELYDAIIYSGFHWIDKNNRIICTEPCFQVPPENIYYELYLKGFLNGCTLLIPKNILIKHGMFPTQYKTIQDYELWIRMAREESFVGQDAVLIKSRQHGEQGSRIMPEHRKEVLDFYKRHLPQTLLLAKKRNYLGQQAADKMLEQIYTNFRMQKQKKAAAYCLFSHPSLIVSLIKAKLKPSLKSNPSTTAQYSNDFTDIYLNDGFAGGGESASGAGSSLLLTRVLRRELPLVLEKYSISSILDCPCGDFNWMRHVKFGDISYTGGDIVKELVERNKSLYTDDRHTFMHIDLTKGPLPRVDALFCRDCLVHLPFADIAKVIRVIKASEIKYLIMTSFSETLENTDLKGVWRPLNFCIQPFCFPEPLCWIDEKCFEGGGNFKDKLLGVWDISKLPELKF